VNDAPNTMKSRLKRHAAQSGQTIDITPNWEQSVGLLIAILADGSAEGRKMAREELLRLARGMDRVNAERAALKARGGE